MNGDQGRPFIVSIDVHPRCSAAPRFSLAFSAVQFLAALFEKIHFAFAPRSLNMNPLGCERSQAAAPQWNEAISTQSRAALTKQGQGHADASLARIYSR
jgi:hypothetical protein